ncbi:sodium:calcium antiporter [Oricola cellulosilytica]|uniref:Sodium/calcium exchanger membrane region domain-containing protein n=1 Tax=Oricola cellulosilytica TaxID=1429082 RepID=A0A4R0P4T0_9HYPH|nr:hypothetical protein [Oricola cellulosilytica]TCD11881.1 hypothetical protein E0D97_16240 [Oricola cellulosilytica]
MLPDMGLFSTAVIFATAGALVWLSGSRLVVYADEIADRLRIGRAMMGFIFLAAATSLPEIVTTGIASASGSSSLALGNLFGGITLQFVILAIADGFVRRGPITSCPRKTTAVLEGTILALLLALLLSVLALGEREYAWNMGAGAFLLGLLYVAAVAVLRRHDEDDPWTPVQVPEPGDTESESIFVSSFPDLSTATLNLRFLLFGAAILGAGAVTIATAERLASQTGLGTGLVGVTLLAGVTSLPELSTTIAAVRLGAYTLAISNIFGSNLLMLALVWPADILFTGGPILNEFELVHELALISGLLVTLVYVAGVVLRSRRQVLGFGYDSLCVLGIFGVTLALYTARS